jgi:hypothetical protein
MISKHKITFDPAENDDYDVVASYLKAADGTLITHTGGALDVNIKTSDIAIEVELDHANDSVKVGDGTDFLEVNADGSINAVVSATDLDIRDLAFATDKVDVTGSEVSLDAATLAALEQVTVSATDLDIRDLTFATDKVDVTGSEVSLDAATLAALESVTVSATDLDIRDLSSSQDSVSIGDGTDFLAVNTDGSINVLSQDAGYSSCVNSAVSVGTTATDLVAADLANRKEITIQNMGAKEIYIGCDASVTIANGIIVPRGATASFKLGPAINVHAITDSGTADVRILELA